MQCNYDSSVIKRSFLELDLPLITDDRFQKIATPVSATMGNNIWKRKEFTYSLER